MNCLPALGPFVPFSHSKALPMHTLAALCSISVNSGRVDESLQTFPLNYPSLPPVPPLDWLLNPAKKRTITNRAIAYLFQLEAHEPDPHKRDDLRQAQITLILASRGNTMPFVVASYQMYGLHPDKVWPAIVARREWLLRPTISVGGSDLTAAQHQPSASNGIGDGHLGRAARSGRDLSDAGSPTDSKLARVPQPAGSESPAVINHPEGRGISAETGAESPIETSSAPVPKIPPHSEKKERAA